VLLEQDHRRVERLFTQAAKDPAAFEQLRDELEVHAAIEEELFYQAVEEAFPEGDDDLVQEARRDHQAVRELLDEMSGFSAGSSEFEDKLERLRRDVERHVEEEETQMFPKTRRALPAQSLSDLGMKMQARREELEGAALSR
jgi:hemerythrin superfamily protein